MLPTLSGGDVLVGARVLRQRRGVDAGLGGESRGADIRGVPVRRAVEELVEGARDSGDLSQRLGRDAGLESLGELLFEQQRRDQRARDWRCRSVRRARSACPGPAVRPARMAASELATALPVSLWAWMASRSRGSCARLRRRCARPRPAACRHWCRRARPSARRRRSRSGARERIFGVGLVAVEKMLAVDHRLPAGLDRRSHAVGDRVEVLFKRAAERDVYVIVPGFGDEHDRVGIGGEQPGEAGIVARPSGRAAWSCRRRRSAPAWSASS